MIQIIWEFRVKAARREDFERIYSAGGDWARLFRKAEGYRETVLLWDCEEPQRYLVIDVWEDEGAYRAFKLKFAAEYAALDKQCEALTDEERSIGTFRKL